MRKLALFTIGFAAAILLVTYAPGERAIVLASLAGTIAILIPGLYLKRYKESRSKHIKTFSVIVTAFFIGALWHSLYGLIFYEPAIALANTESTTTFVVLDYPAQYAYSSRLYAETEIGKYKTNLTLKDRLDVKPGDKITLTVSFSTPEATKDFDFLTYYRSKGIFIDAAQSNESRAIVESRDRISWRFWPIEAQHAVIHKLGLLFEGNEKGLISGLLTGDRTDLSQSFQFALSTAGISHIISVSGMHVSYLVGFILLLFKKRKSLAAFIAIPVMIFFVLMTGAASSAIRACVMQVMVLGAGLLGREDDKLTSLSAALLFLLVINPFCISDIGLQLSFLATLGLILFSPKMNAWFLKKMPYIKKDEQKLGNPIVSFLSSTLSATFSATLLTLLPVAYYFGRVSLIAPLSNLASLWMVSAVFFLGILCVGASFIYLPVAKLLAIPLSYGLKYIKAVADLSVRIPFSALDARNEFIILWLVFLCIVLVFWMRSNKEKLYTIISFCMIAVTLASALLFTEISGSAPDMRIAVLNVGQGQAIAATSGAYTALIDCGGNRWPGAGNIVAEYLLGHNRRRIDLLILTHTHSDHINGLEDLMEHVDIRCAAVLATKAADETATMLAEHGVKVIRIDSDYQIRMGKCRIHLYRPIVRGEDEGVCALLSVGDFEALITGDLERVSERILTEREVLPDIELFLAGHHGSKESSTEALLADVKPDTAIISVGKNTYGHPSSETLARLKKQGAYAYRTDQRGTIEIDVKG